ncbi:clasp N terminal-domain-containing protein [Gautieria morchelliformis]|nr:clasp N terminal-domain-containing protein [Gautieria morchelliformis]
MSTSEERISPLISKCKSSGDVDTKVDAVSKLQAEFEAGLFDIEGVISGLNACLRTPNQHLSTATLAAILPLFPLLLRRPLSPITSSSSHSAASADAAILRQALNAFLPSGGIIERLGDNREKAREKAKEALLAIGTVVFTAAPPPANSFRGKEAKGAEAPFQIYERCLREQGLASKSWRVREQSILTLVQLRRSHPLFPLRPFLSPLVDALEDGDGTVRECARQAVVEIFTGHGVTDAARTDLKKEMTKKGVRKTIVDSVLIKLLSGEGRNTPLGDNADGKEDSRPSTLTAHKPSAPFMPTTGRSVSHSVVSDLDTPPNRAGEINPGDADVTPVYIASARDLENEFLSMLPHFEGKETEHNWLARERSVIRIRGMLKGDAHSRYPETFIAGLKNGVLEATLKALASLRTTVSACTCSLYSDLAVSLASGLDPFAETLLIPLLRMAGFTKKIIASQTQDVVDAILIHTSCPPRQTLPLLWASVQDKTVQARAFAAGHVKTYLHCHGMRSKHSIESTGGIDMLDKCVRRGLADPNPGVREKARASFWSFEAIWKERGLSILESLDAAARKQLQNVCPVPLEELGLPKHSTPANKKTSVAAAIAASRAKAKQIATAPPTLRHKATATSHAHASRATSPPAPTKRPISPIVTLPRSSPSPRASSPSSSPRSAMLRSSNGPATAYDRQRTRSPVSSSPSPPPSPTIGTHRRRTSSPLVTQSLIRPMVQHNSHISRAPISSASSPPFNPRTSSALRTPVNPTTGPRQIGLPKGDFPSEMDQSLLIATSIPLPSESEPTDDESVNLMTFSAPWELSHPPSQSASSSPTPSSSRIGRVPHSVVEDALRARAAQAESAAAQLLELVDADDGHHLSPIPPSLLPNNGATPILTSRTLTGPPVTPNNQASGIMREAALYKDSPAYNGASPSIFELIEERKHQTSWWLKRMSIIDQGTTISSDVVQRVQELEEYTTALEKGVADLRILRKLILLCHRNPCHAPTSPPTSPLFPKSGRASGTPMSPETPSPHAMYSGNAGLPLMLGDIWEGGTRSEKLFNALGTLLQPDKDTELLEHGLFVLWEMLPHLDGHDTDVFALLLRLRYAQDFNVDEGTLTIRDAQVELMNERNYTLYGLSTMEHCLKAFLAQPIPSQASHDAKLRAHAFGLVTLAKFIIRLPADILEEELPKIKLTLTDAYLNSEAMVRQAATTAITAAQVILQDETHLFALLEPLPDDKKNLLTYFFEKNHARGAVERVDASSGVSGMERLSKEMDRLDQRISTPPKHRGP